ncbi:MAG: hypothetical protein O2819_09385, partial [Planctomycetota bacterium]|nr:hypothetical protein [Planctomycetota bacterium]
GLFDCEGRFHVMRAGERAGERVGEITRERTQDQRGTTGALCAGNHAALEQRLDARERPLALAQLFSLTAVRSE